MYPLCYLVRFSGSLSSSLPHALVGELGVTGARSAHTAHAQGMWGRATLKHGEMEGGGLQAQGSGVGGTGILARWGSAR
eukprot:14823257-Alexandrium_andersonii.AAC.1